MIHKIDFSTAKALLDARSDAVLLDVREEEEYIAGHASGAVLLPVGQINAETASRLPGAGPVLVYCRTGFRSHRAAMKLEKLGIDQIYDLGSLAGWPYGMRYGEE